MKNETDKDKEDKVLTKWKSRFVKAERFRKPYVQKWLRMYRLYKGYREALNYAYGTSLMPPIGYEVIETIKPRLSSAKIKTRMIPREATDVHNETSIEKWDDLVHYNLEHIEFDDKKVDWINSALLYGNGVAQIMWEGDADGDPYLEIVDNFLFYPDPKAGNRLKDSRWEIKQIFRDKIILEQEEEERGENRLYDEAEFAKVENQKVTEDPRLERNRINTLKSSQINDNTVKGQVNDVTAGPGDATRDKEEEEKTVEIWECYDHVSKKLQVIMNREHVVRDEENPYLPIREGRVFIDLPCIKLNWEYYAMAILEPVETTIYEIADSRNQAMDNIVYNLDPIRKIRRGKGYKDTDIVSAPGAAWYLDRSDDVVFERPPDISQSWVEKDAMLRTEIQTSLAMSEYVQGMPQSAQEPMGKVELLLMQSNIRFSGIVRQLEIAYTELVNALIEMNQEFLGESKSFRILGDDFRFQEFTTQEREVKIDAIVEVMPKREKGPEQEAKEVVELYELLVTQDQPDPNNQIEMMQWKEKKTEMQKLILQKFDYEDYEDILVKEPTMPPPQTPTPMEGGQIPIQPGGMAAVQPEMMMAGPEPQPVEMLPLEGEQAAPPTMVPEAQPREGFLRRLAGRFSR